MKFRYLMPTGIEGEAAAAEAGSSAAAASGSDAAASAPEAASVPTTAGAIETGRRGYGDGEFVPLKNVKRVVAVVGAAHVPGIKDRWRTK